MSDETKLQVQNLLGVLEIKDFMLLFFMLLFFMLLR